MEFTVLQMVGLLGAAFVVVAAGERSSTKADSCPEPFTCYNCPGNWIYPDISYKGVFVDDDLCDVTFTWDWVQEDDINPLLVFLCFYEDGTNCDVGNESQCGSCQNFTIYGLSPSKNPTVSYSDTCGNVYDVEIGSSCSDGPSLTTADPNNPTTDPPVITTKPANPTTQSPTDSPTTDPPVMTTKPANPTTQSPTDSPTSDTLTTESSSTCPSVSNCSGCPLDWVSPNFHFTGTPTAEGLCDVQITWEWKYPPELDENPALNFLCIYGANGEYCESGLSSVCGSCESVSFAGLDLSYHPYIDYADTCSNIQQLWLGEDCLDIGGFPQTPPSSGGDKTSLD